MIALVFPLGICWWIWQIGPTCCPSSWFPVLQWLKSWSLRFSDFYVVTTRGVIQIWQSKCALTHAGRQRWDGNFTSAVCVGKHGGVAWISAAARCLVTTATDVTKRDLGCLFMCGGDHSTGLGLDLGTIDLLRVAFSPRWFLSYRWRCGSGVNGFLISSRFLDAI